MSYFSIAYLKLVTRLNYILLNPFKGKLCLCVLAAFIRLLLLNTCGYEDLQECLYYLWNFSISSLWSGTPIFYDIIDFPSSSEIYRINWFEVDMLLFIHYKIYKQIDNK